MPAPIGGSVIGSSLMSVLGCRPAAQRREIAQRLDRGAGLPLRLGGAIELAHRIGEAARHGEDAAGLVLQDHRRSLHHRPHPQFRARRGLALGVASCLDHANEDHVVERELALGGGVVDRKRQDAAIGEADPPGLALLAARLLHHHGRRPVHVIEREPGSRQRLLPRRPPVDGLLARPRFACMALARFASAPRN